MMNKALPAIAACVALLTPTAAHAASTAPALPVQAAPASTPSVVTRQFDTVAELMRATGLSGTVQTRGHASAGDGAGMTFSIASSRPSGITGAMAVPLADGKWAIPQNLPTSPTTQPSSTSVEDAVARARTFAAAGSDLVWDPTRQTPLSESVVHAQSNKPYALTCSSFVGMVLQGWDYQHTTFVADQNSRVGDWVDFGAAQPGDLWQAHKLARWFYANGDLWLDAGAGGYQRGDLLFFSQQDPEGRGTSGNYFGNIYHVGIYLGDGRIIHSTGASAGAGVIEQDLTDRLRADISFVARPTWQQLNTAPAQPAPEASESTTVPEDASPGESVPPEPSDPATAEQEEPATTDRTHNQADPKQAGTPSDASPAPSTGSPSTSTPATPSPATRPVQLPVTGAGLGWLITGTAALLGTGGAFAGLARRRHKEDPPPEKPKRAL